MAVAFDSGSAIAASTGADISPVVGAPPVGALMLLQTVARSNAVTCLTPAGWTLLAGPSDSGTTWRSYWFWRIATASETDPLCDWSAVTGDKYARIWKLTGNHTTSPFVNTAVTMGTADPGVATGVTTDAANQFVGSFGFGADNLATTATITATDPASLPLFVYQTTAIGADAGSWAASGIRATAGATGNVSHDFDGVPLAWAILIAAIREPAAVTPVPDVVMAPLTH